MDLIKSYVSNPYGLVLLTATGISFHVFYTGATKAGSIRYKTFSKEFVERLKKSAEGNQLIKDHAAALNITEAEAETALAKGAYPEMGNGRIAQFLTYDEWIKFNDGQRAHYNYLESAPSALALLLIGGTRAPLVTSALGLTFIVGRELYAQGYAKKGPNARMAGGVLSGLSFLALVGTAVYSSIKIARSNP